MRWLKHLTSTRRDEKVANLMAARNGHASYGLWWAVLEVIGSSVEKGDTKASLRYPLSTWAKLLQIRPCNLMKQLGPLSAAGLLSVSRLNVARSLTTNDTQATCKRHASEIELSAPNLLKYRDEWQRKLRSDSGVTPELRTDIYSTKSSSSTKEQNPSNIYPSTKKPGARKKNARARSSHSQAFSDKAIELFIERYDSKPTWTDAHYVQLASLLKRDADLTLEEFVRRYRIFLTSPIPFHQQQTGSLQFFCSRFDQFIARPMTETARESRAEEKERKSREAIELVRRSREGANGDGSVSGNGIDAGPGACLLGAPEGHSSRRPAAGRNLDVLLYEGPAGDTADGERDQRLLGAGAERARPRAKARPPANPPAGGKP